MTNKIGWTDQTWNPVVGCTRCSPGCDNCYAATMAKRQAGMARARRDRGENPGRSAHYEKVENWDGVELVPEALNDPLKWKKARRIFVCSMGDLFHEDVPDSFICRVFAHTQMGLARRHTFQILTKRALRAKRWIARYSGDYVADNIWLGVTAENQEQADKRIPILLQIPAAVRFASIEPMLEEIDIDEYLPQYDYRPTYEYYRLAYPGMTNEPIKLIDGLDQVIVGAETGPGKRPMELDWARSLCDQCQTAGVPFFFKKDSQGNHDLDGRVWEEFPR